MPRIEPLHRSDLPEFEPVFRGMDESIGYVPNSFFTMGRNPGILSAVGAMMDAFWYPQTVTEPVRRLVTFAYSWFARSPYSAAHCACGAVELGLPMEKILSVGEFETASVYSDADRAVLRLCYHSARLPASATSGDVETMRRYFSEQQVVFIIGLISMMAFLNRWNEVVQTELEPIPLAWAKANLPGFDDMMRARPS